MSTPVNPLPIPDGSLHDVGPDTARLGRAKRQLALLQHWGLTPQSDLLEIGCGVGRLAYQLASFLNGGRYAGFDLSKPAISWLDANYAPLRPDFRFDHVKVQNARYKMRRGRSAARFSFPYEDDRFDIACSFAVFMHMQLKEIENYIRETFRVLRPGGRAVLAMTAITADDRRLPQLPVHGHVRFQPVGDGMYAKHPELLTQGLGFDHELLHKRLRSAGFDVVAFTAGTWRSPELVDPPLQVVGGDVFVVEVPKATGVGRVPDA
jgi:SAM-dependent methyltransferase